MVVAAVVLGLPVGVSVISGLTIYGGLNLIGRGVETFTNPDIAGEIEKGRSKLARFSELIGSVKRYENTHVDTIKKMEQIRDMSETIIDEIEKKE